MATAPEQFRMSVAEFLEWDDGTDTRYELLGGKIVAMAPATPAHSVIVSNLTIEIGTRIKSPCYLANEAGIQLPHREDIYYEADLALICAPLPTRARELPQPRLIVEILSRSTAAHDRGRKGADYRTIPAVQEILFVSSEERRVELWRREEKRWVIEDFIGEAALRLDTIGAEIPLAAIYANVSFENAAEASETGA
jgi:Uma2 family endonuclease